MARDDPSSYEIVASVSKQSQNTIKDEYATNDVRPRLAFRCTPGKYSILVQIEWQRFISSFNSEVGFSIGGDHMLWQKWGVDQSNKITSSKSSSDSKALVDKLVAGRQLSVEVTPYSGSPLMVHFDLAGYPRALDASREACQ